MRRLLAGKLTEQTLALWGAEALLAAMDRRNGLGFALPSATRHGLWWRLTSLAAALAAREGARTDEGATDARCAELAGEAERTLHKLADYHARKILPRVAALPPLPSAAELIGARAPGGAAILPFPRSRGRTPTTVRDDDPPGAA